MTAILQVTFRVFLRYFCRLFSSWPSRAYRLCSASGLSTSSNHCRNIKIDFRCRSVLMGQCFLKEYFALVGEGISYLVRQSNRHKSLELVEVQRSSLVAVVLVEYGSHLFLSRVLVQRQQGLFQLDLQHQAVSIAVVSLLAVEYPRHRSGVGRVELVVPKNQRHSEW